MPVLRDRVRLIAQPPWSRKLVRTKRLDLTLAHSKVAARCVPLQRGRGGGDARTGRPDEFDGAGSHGGVDRTVTFARLSAPVDQWTSVKLNTA